MELMTIAEIAKHLELPESTVRYYRDRFAPYVPSVGEGRGRRYRPEALAVLRFIADALRSGVPAEDVEVALRARFPVTVEPQQQSAATQQQQSARPQQSAAVMRELIADALRSIAEETTQPLLDELRKTAAELRSVAAENAALRKELETQQQQMAAALERLAEAQERRDAELRAWLEERLPPAKAKRWALVARIRAILARDRGTQADLGGEKRDGHNHE